VPFEERKMRIHAFSVWMLIALGVTHCSVETASARGFAKPRNDRGGGAHAFTRGTTSTSSSISFKKDGRAVTIEENGSGITVTVDGNSVRARNVDELKQQHPDAYQLYAEKPGFAVGSAGGSARASSSQSTSSTQGSHPGSLESKSSGSKDRSVTVIENGKKVTIEENASGITVTVGGERIRARSATELKRKSVKAFELYEKHLTTSDTGPENVDAESLLRGALEEKPGAADLLRRKLEEMKEQNAHDPSVQQLLERMLRENDK